MPIQCIWGLACIMGMEVRKECMLKEVIFPMVREYGIRIKYAHPMIQFILTMMTLFFIFQRKYVKFQFIEQFITLNEQPLGCSFSYPPEPKGSFFMPFS
nr:MAG TPA: hypothetical protein [Caudoviricetes sp.]